MTTSQTPEAADQGAASLSELPGQAELSSDPAYIAYATRLLAFSELTDGLADLQLARLATIGQVRTYTGNELICDEQERSDELYIVHEGAVEVWLDPSTIGKNDAEERRIAVLQEGQTCGELALLDGGVRSAKLRAGPHGATLVAFNRKDLIGLCDSSTDIGYRIMSNLAGALALRLRLQDMQLYEG